jgi:lysophospholipid acyltransferase (LPLAT)-like uncharacterized protein
MSQRDLLNSIVVSIINLISKTWRITVEGKLRDCSVIAFWHSDMLPIWKYFSGTNSAAVVSLSKDGELLAQLLRQWGYALIRGSSSKNSKEVLKEIISNLAQRNVLITPDGPQGPNRKMKPGAVISAMRTNSPLFLVKVKLGWHIRFRKSWDKFALPLPFSKIKLSIVGPFFFPISNSREYVENSILALERILNN